MKPTRAIPISVAEWIAKEYTYDQVIVYARKVGEDPGYHGEHMTTYGVDRANCDAAAKIGDFLKYKIMGWAKENVCDHASTQVEAGLDSASKA